MNAAEQSIIAVLIQFPEEAEKIYAKIIARMFSSVKLGKIFETAKKMSKAGKPIDKTTLMSEIQGCGEAIDECLSLGVQKQYIGAYIAVMLESWRKRDILEKCGTLAEKDADGMVSELQKILTEQSRISSVISNETVSDIQKGIEDVIKKQSEEDTSLKVKSWAQFLDIVGGFQRGGVYVISGRPGGGKTDFALQIAVSLSINYRVLYQSMEMTTEQNIQRVLSRVCQINGEKFRDKVLSQEELARIDISKKHMTRLNFWVDDDAHVDMERLEANISMYKPECVIIDHLGLMDSPKKQKRNDELSELTSSLKKCAMYHNIVIIELVQLSRAADKEEPKMGDMFGSATIEHDADGIIAMRPMQIQNKLSGDDCAFVDVIVLKNRHGSTGTMKFKWRPQYHLYEEGD